MCNWWNEKEILLYSISRDILSHYIDSKNMSIVSRKDSNQSNVNESVHGTSISNLSPNHLLKPKHRYNRQQNHCVHIWIFGREESKETQKKALVDENTKTKENIKYTSREWLQSQVRANTILRNSFGDVFSYDYFSYTYNTKIDNFIPLMLKQLEMNITFRYLRIERVCISSSKNSTIPFCMFFFLHYPCNSRLSNTKKKDDFQ